MKKKINIMIFAIIFISFGLGITFASSIIIDSADVSFDNEGTTLSSSNVQNAIDELNVLANTSNSISTKNFIRDTMIIDNDNQNKTWTYKNLLPGNYLLLELCNLYSMNSASYSNWNIGSFSTLKGVPTNGIVEGGSGQSTLYSFYIDEPTLPSVFIYNYYPNNENASTYNFIIGEIVDSEHITTTQSDETWNTKTLEPGEYFLVESTNLYSFKSASYSNWSIGDFKVLRNGNSVHGQYSNQGSFYLYEFTLENSATPTLMVHDYYPNNTSAASYNYWIIRKR